MIKMKAVMHSEQSGSVFLQKMTHFQKKNRDYVPITGIKCENKK